MFEVETYQTPGTNDKKIKLNTDDNKIENFILIWLCIRYTSYGFKNYPKALLIRTLQIEM